MNVKQAKFNIGQIVRHSESGFRGVIVDVDPEFTQRGTDIRPDREKQYSVAEPWYHVLLDEQNLQAYVAEQQLQGDSLGEPINHVYVDEYFSEFDWDHYVVRYPLN